MTRRRFSTGLLGFVSGGLLGGELLAASEARASSPGTFFAIVTRLTGARRPHSHLEASFDTLASSPIDFAVRVFEASGVQIADFTARANQNGFASTATLLSPNDNLLELAGDLPALVQVTTPASSQTAAAAVLQREGNKATVRHEVPTAVRWSDGVPLAAGRLFAVPIGEIAGEMSLLIANVSGPEVNIDVFQGTKGPDGGGKYTRDFLGPNAIWRVDLQPDDANSHIIVSGTNNLIVQLAVANADGLDMATIIPRA